MLTIWKERSRCEMVCITNHTQCTCAEFKDFAKQCNGGGGREKGLWTISSVIELLTISSDL
jgi:hypothetical protein